MRYEEAVKIAEGFCSKTRSALTAPRYRGGRVYASNGYVAVRIAIDRADQPRAEEVERASGLGEFVFDKIDEVIDGKGVVASGGFDAERDEELDGKGVVASGGFDAERVKEIEEEYADELVEWRTSEAIRLDRLRMDSTVECPHCNETLYIVDGEVVDEKHFEVDNDDFEYRVAVKYGGEWDLFNFGKIIAMHRACGEGCRIEVWRRRIKGGDLRGAELRARSRDGEVEVMLLGLLRPTFSGVEPSTYGADHSIQLMESGMEAN
jgi:hypothetical protein